MEQDDKFQEIVNQAVSAKDDLNVAAVLLRRLELGESQRRRCLRLVEGALGNLESITAALAGGVGVLFGSRGGQKTAERGPEYYRQIAAMRKTRAGGRPRKVKSASETRQTKEQSRQ